MFLYLTTRGWKTGRSHQIEIWFVELDGHFFLISEKRLRSHWVQNLKRDRKVRFRVGRREFEGEARVIEADSEQALRQSVEEVFQAEYGWSDGLMVRLTPSGGARYGLYSRRCTWVSTIGKPERLETESRLPTRVALKVLPAEMASSPERLERFRRGSEALAALDHPGIVSVFSVEGADGVHFLTMQLVEGRRLDQVIPQGGLPPETLLAHATTLAASVQLLLWRGSLAELQIQWTAVGSRRQMPWVAMNWR